MENPRHVIRRERRGAHQTTTRVVCSKQQPRHRGVVGNAQRRQHLRRESRRAVRLNQQRRSVDDVEGYLVDTSGVRGDKVAGGIDVRPRCVEMGMEGNVRVRSP